MGVNTRAYSIPPKMMRKIKADNNNLGYILDYLEDENGVFCPTDDKSKLWQVESYDFDSQIDVYIKVFRTIDFVKIAKSLDSDYADLDTFDFNPYNVWAIMPAEIKAICKECENATVDELKAKVINSEITDRRGNVFSESELESYLSDIEGIKKFFDKAFEHGNYLIFAEA